MVLGYCIVHNVLLFLRSREWRVLVRIFSRRRRFRAGFSSLLGVLEVGSLLRMVTNDFECTRCNTHICTWADQNIRTYIYIYIERKECRNKFRVNNFDLIDHLFIFSQALSPIHVGSSGFKMANVCFTLITSNTRNSDVFGTTTFSC